MWKICSTCAIHSMPLVLREPLQMTFPYWGFFHQRLSFKCFRMSQQKQSGPGRLSHNAKPIKSWTNCEANSWLCSWNEMPSSIFSLPFFSMLFHLWISSNPYDCLDPQLISRNHSQFDGWVSLTQDVTLKFEAHCGITKMHFEEKGRKKQEGAENSCLWILGFVFVFSVFPWKQESQI